MLKKFKLFIILPFLLCGSICSGNSPPKYKFVELEGGERIEFVYIPPGKLVMGSSENESGRQSDEGPQREVQITRGFYLGKFEVTQQQWTAVMGNNPSVFKTLPKPENLPVESVSWYECQEFIARLDSLFDGNFRLPSEAEWEYACRAGTSSKYYWGDFMTRNGTSDYSWANSRSMAMPHPVGEKKPNNWGLYDMSGNVWEWCSDWYGSYLSEETIDPKGPEMGTYKVFRGGSWYDFRDAHRSANRHKHAPDLKFTAIGLRLVLEI